MDGGTYKEEQKLTREMYDQVKGFKAGKIYNEIKSREISLKQISKLKSDKINQESIT